MVLPIVISLPSRDGSRTIVGDLAQVGGYWEGLAFLQQGISTGVALSLSLLQLGLEYVNLYLVHHPLVRAS